MKKKLVAVMALGTLALVGCSGASSHPVGNTIYRTVEVEHTLDDGRKMDCLIYSPDDGRGGITCDWGNAK